MTKEPTLFVTDEEMFERLGVPEKIAGPVVRELDAKSTGFPRKQKLWGDRRYWPAIRDYLDATCGITLRLGADRLATENRDRTRLPRRHPSAVLPMRRSTPDE